MVAVPFACAEEFVGLNMDDFVFLTSYSHHPFYKPFIIEVPDNWSWGQVYNLPLNELMEVFDYAINNNHSITWAADVSEKGFSWKNGVAIVPEKDIENMSGMERTKWEKLTKREQEASLYKFTKPGKEKIITPIKKPAINVINPATNPPALARAKYWLAE